MLPEIQQQFHTTAYIVNLTISIYTLVLALMQIVYGPLIDTRGRRKVLIPAVLIYVAASIGAALSTSIQLFLLFRALQAFGMASGTVVATTVIGDLFEDKMRGRAMGTFQMIAALGPVLGPVVGGLVGEHLGFHDVFWILASSAFVMWSLNFLFLPETKPSTINGERFSVRDFSEVLTQSTGLVVVTLGFVQYYTFYNFMVFLPVILSNFYHLSPGQNGFVFLPMSLFIVVGTKTGGRIQEYFDKRKLLLMTTLLNMFAILLFVLLSEISLPLLIVSISLFGFCGGLSLPVQTTLLTDSFQRKRATAIGVYNLFRYIGMAAGPMIGTLFLPMGNQMEFVFAAVLFACVILFAAIQFSPKQEKPPVRLF